MVNSYRNSHILCFDPVYKKQTGTFQGVCYEGSYEPIPIEKSIVKNDDGSVTLYFFCPDAKKIEVEYADTEGVESGKEGPISLKKIRKEMMRSSDHYWYIHLMLAPKYYDIFYYIDGVKVINTHQSYGYDGDSIFNYLDLTKDEDFFISDVPHGCISREIYPSNNTGRYRACWIYTPADYAANQNSYPVLYVQHGGGEDEICWFQSGKLDILLDNLIAKGEVEPMIVVANNGYAFKQINEEEGIECRFDDIIIQDCMPYIESRYRIMKDRSCRAAAGLSMGGGHTRRLAFSHLEEFANVGIFSSFEGFPTEVAGYDFHDVLKDPKEFNRLLDFAMVSCGDKDPRIIKTRQMVNQLQKDGFHIELAVYHGHHEWDVWRNSIKYFVKNIFKRRRYNVSK